MDRPTRRTVLVWSAVAMVALGIWLAVLARGSFEGFSALGIALPGLLPLVVGVSVLFGPPAPLPRRPAVVRRERFTVVQPAPASPMEGGLLALMLLAWLGFGLAAAFAFAALSETSFLGVYAVCALNLLSVLAVVATSLLQAHRSRLVVDRVRRTLWLHGAPEPVDLYSLTRVDVRPPDLVLGTLEASIPHRLPGASRRLLEEVARALRAEAEPLGGFDPAQARARKAAHAALAPVTEAARD